MAKSGSSSNNRRKVGRYVNPEASGRITARRPITDDHSPHWYGWLIVDLMAFGVMVITLNYLAVLPGSVSSWYLVLGLVALFCGFYMATRYK